jgi:biopolymer transport protein ExbD
MASEVEAAPEAEIDMTPMIDVTFLLIVFFMVVSDMSALDIAELTLPFASEAAVTKVENIEENPMLIINVIKDGTVKIAGQDFTTKSESEGGLTSLKEYLKIEAEAAAREPAPADNPGLRASKLRVLIRGDRDTPFKNIQSVFDACQKNGIYKTSLGATKEDVDGAE